MRSALFLAVALVACARPPAAVPAPQPAPSREGAILLAHAGSGQTVAVAGAPREFVRGRARFRVDESGATRFHDVTHDPANIALALPGWLGDGIALFGDDGVWVANGAALRPIARASLTGPSIGAREIWARMRKDGSDWVRIDVARGEAIAVAPPLAAPLTIPVPLLGRAVTGGPEFASPTFAVALVDLLGPVLSHDAGATWSPIDGVREAFAPSSPTRLLRDHGAVAIASDDRMSFVSSTGVVAAPTPIAKVATSVPDVAAVRVESLAPFGVPLPNGELLVVDGPRLARVQLDPVRVVRVTRDDSLTRCELAPAKNALAIAVCTRHDEGTLGARLVVGTIVDGPSGMRLSVERSFPHGAGAAISSSGAVAIAAPCSGSQDAYGELVNASRACTRDASGAWIEVSLTGSRTAVVPRAEGGVWVLRGDGKELVAIGKSLGKPLKLGELQTVVSIDEVEPERLVLWSRRGSDVRSVRVAVKNDVATTSERRTIIDDRAAFAAHGAHALIATAKQGGAIDASLTNDAGDSWIDKPFGDARALAEASAECGGAGCRAFGWSRVGWQPNLLSVDRVSDLEALPKMTAPPPPPKRATLLSASCVRLAAKKTVPPVGLTTSYTNVSFLGLPPPKAAAGQSLAIGPFVAGAVRGAVLSIGPSSGPWNGSGRSVVRFTSDLDPPGVVHESAPFVSPFADRLSAGASVYAFALAPGRVLVSLWRDGRSELHRVEAGAQPERIDLSAQVTIGRVVSAREASGTLLVTGSGRRPEGVAPSPFFAFEQTPFVALVGPSAKHAWFPARADVDELHLAATVDTTRGMFGVATYGALPTWTGGTLHVLPLAADARPAGGFAVFSGPQSDVAQPTIACTPAMSGWERTETMPKAFALTIDKEPTPAMQANAVIRSRLGGSGACIDRITLLRSDAVFQLDVPARRAVYLALDDGAQTAHRDELSCSFTWE